MLEQNPETVKIVFKHFPLSSHRMAAQAALAAVAAQKQGKFWQYHDLLFSDYHNLSLEKFEEFARKLHLDMELFQKESSDPKTRSKVRKDYQEGKAAGVNGTPTIFINGRLLRDRSVAGMQKIIDDYLNPLPTPGKN